MTRLAETVIAMVSRLWRSSKPTTRSRISDCGVTIKFED